jgi:hypothetical protein
MPRYMLLLHEAPTGPVAELSPEEIQAVIARYKAWRQSLGSRIESGEKLKEEGSRALRRDAAAGVGGSGKVRVLDGPYTEAKEILGGYFLLQAASYDEAVRLSESCPHLDFGWIQIREIEET